MSRNIRILIANKEQGKVVDSKENPLRFNGSTSAGLWLSKREENGPLLCVYDSLYNIAELTLTFIFSEDLCSLAKIISTLGNNLTLLKVVVIRLKAIKCNTISTSFKSEKLKMTELRFIGEPEATNYELTSLPMCVKLAEWTDNVIIQ
jgi:hypothetical protein